MKDHLIIDQFREELHLFNLLSQLFLTEPTKEFMRGILSIDLPPESDDQSSSGLRLMVDAARKNSHRLDQWIEDLSIEYARLFIGPRNPPAVPYASFYLSESHSLMTDETIKVRKTYLDAGMAVKELHSVPDDHIGIELEFVYSLTRKMLDLLEQGAREDAHHFFEIRSDFLNGHMASWVPCFLREVMESTSDDFYRGAALMLKELFAL